MSSPGPILLDASVGLATTPAQNGSTTPPHERCSSDSPSSHSLSHSDGEQAAEGDDEDEDDAIVFYHAAHVQAHAHVLEPDHHDNNDPLAQYPPKMLSHPPSSFPGPRDHVHVRQASEPFFDNGLPVNGNTIHDAHHHHQEQQQQQLQQQHHVKWQQPQPIQPRQQQQQQQQHPHAQSQPRRPSNSGTTTRSSSSQGWMAIVRYPYHSLPVTRLTVHFPPPRVSCSLS
ncbi:hypothetical protein BKA62DRAFT_299528 [Auriculariales sp. MPI-PUGE-AT-0066]|nr:hypothetical protein BKA62DRAFT_299528 [Auriculariales sp. MPI-PUGE-AT-0066]